MIIGVQNDRGPLGDEQDAEDRFDRRVQAILGAEEDQLRPASRYHGSLTWPGCLLRWSGRVSGDGPGGYFCPAADVQLAHHVMQVDFGGLF